MTLTTSTADFGWRPDSVFFPPADVVPQALILQVATQGGVIDGDQPSLHVPFVNDTEDAGYVAEAAEIPESNPGLDEVLIVTKKISRLVSLSNEQYRKQMTAEQVSQSVARDLVQKADASFIGDLSNPVGLINTIGTLGGYNIASNLDDLVEAVAAIEDNGGTPGAIIVSPNTWASVQKLKLGATFDNAYTLGVGVEVAQPRLLSLPVFKSRFIPDWTGLVVDPGAVVAAVGPVQVAVSEHSMFASDSVQLRATWRIGWACPRPDRIAKFSTEMGS
ncbi:phage major capsid protein [Mycobacterium sp. CVI_P3]|uniref:Phage major capsid protein n=1 Tax=Mycobacterium pinniadriaticum TaxID=2994102 RepID=A0ABT3SA14_9MYCO|nr:phage major capsid protein [Mycobacterium pinniadriaticum]MCX2929267.1 phage major capsid protein [Mycobacterium pinniadriaticum]MCX2935692.1 phage major capsid protein [Mycobacterium pinniadriaticum]